MLHDPDFEREIITEEPILLIGGHTCPEHGFVVNHGDTHVLPTGYRVLWESVGDLVGHDDMVGFLVWVNLRWMLVWAHMNDLPGSFDEPLKLHRKMDEQLLNGDAPPVIRCLNGLGEVVEVRNLSSRQVFGEQN